VALVTELPLIEEVALLELALGSPPSEVPPALPLVDAGELLALLRLVERLELGCVDASELPASATEPRVQVDPGNAQE
jgi:hypothetical protein